MKHAINISFHFHLPKILILPPPKKKSQKMRHFGYLGDSQGEGKGKTRGVRAKRGEIEREREVTYVKIIYN